MVGYREVFDSIRLDAIRDLLADGIPKLKADTVSTENVNNEVYAAKFDGADLSDKVDNALTWLSNNTDSRGRILITPKGDGTAWSWGSNVTIDNTVYEGVEIDVVRGAKIDCTMGGYAITIENGFDTDAVKIEGGDWTCSASDPNGWLQIKDSYGTIVKPLAVHSGWSNSNNDARCVSIENHSSYSEATTIEHCRLVGDICVDSLPAAVTGGSGTDSLHETYLHNVDTRGNVYGLRMRGNWDYSGLHRVTFKAGADGWVGLKCAQDFARGMGVISCKWEDNGGRSNTTGIEDTGGNNWYGPLFLGAFFNALDTDWNVGDETQNIKSWEGKEFEIDAPGAGNTWGFHGGTGDFTTAGTVSVAGDMDLSGGFNGTVNHTGGGPVYHQIGGTNVWNYTSNRFRTTGGKPIQYGGSDVRNISSPEQGDTAYHDPSINGDSNTEGPAFYDGSGWTSLVDGSAIN